MSFKKCKIVSSDPVESSGFSSIKNQYHSLKKRNFFSGIFLGALALSCIIGISVVTFAHLPSFHFDFLSLPFGGGASLFKEVTGSEKGKINILLTGIGGGVHEGGDLTDTIMLASLNSDAKTVSLLSIPRDLYIAYPRSGVGKINETYRRSLKATGTPTLAMQEFGEKIREITGEKVDHYLNVDFDGFVKFIDLLGGVEIDVPSDLVDTQYPSGEDMAYMTFSIKKGHQTLDGETALKYARSRHSTSDFDRSLRQQLVIKAIKEKLLSLDYITSPSKMRALYYAVNSHIQTDLDMGQLLSIALFGKDLPSENILSFNLNDSCFQGLAFCERGGFLYTPMRDLFGGASVLLPDGATPGHLGAYTEISKFANLIFNYPGMFLERPEINIVNSTKVSGIANKIAVYLKKFGFNVPDKDSIGSTKDPYLKTEVFHTWDDINKTGIDPKSKTLEALSLFFFSPQTAVPTNKYSKYPSPKIEIVVGKDYKLFYGQ